MKSHEKNNHSSKHGIFACVLLCCTLVANILFVDRRPVFALSLNEELSIDRTLGVLYRPWKINLIRLATRDYLRLSSQIQTGLPTHDQRISNTNPEPDPLVKVSGQITAPKPQAKPSASPATQAPSNSPTPPPIGTETGGSPVRPSGNFPVDQPTSPISPPGGFPVENQPPEQPMFIPPTYN